MRGLGSHPKAEPEYSLVADDDVADAAWLADHDGARHLAEQVHLTQEMPRPRRSAFLVNGPHHLEPGRQCRPDSRRGADHGGEGSLGVHRTASVEQVTVPADRRAARDRIDMPKQQDERSCLPAGLADDIAGLIYVRGEAVLDHAPHGELSERRLVAGR